MHQNPSHPAQLRIADFTYELPEEKIARHPLLERDSSKLLVCQKGLLQQTRFNKIENYLPDASILVFNSSKVINARLNFSSGTNKKIEVFCLEPWAETDPAEALCAGSPQQWKCLVGNLKAWKEEDLNLNLNGVELKAKLLEKLPGHVRVEFSWNKTSASFSDVLKIFGEVPIPPYLKRGSEKSDSSTYQTMYAKKEGSVAAPTAGLHFTEDVLNQLKAKQVSMQYLHLHVGAGTFKPVKSEQLKDHDMHTEWLDVERSLLLTLSKSNTKHIVAIGTTSLRTLESLYWMGVKTLANPLIELEELELKQWEVYTLDDQQASVEKSFLSLINWMDKHGLERLLCKTGILIAPPYTVRVVKGLLTNFHQPQSTLLLLVAALLGDDWKKAYAYALQNNFRFLSYGDAMLIEL